MSTTLQILLTAVLVGGGIGSYHLVAAERETNAGTEAAVADRDLAAIEERLHALEVRSPMLQ
ncbi:MAG: hypothetical protein ACYTG6_02305, partial [Planctomycetota bacterium]